MWYVIPFVVLLLIAVLLKKREANKEEATTTTKSKTKKKGSKKAAKYQSSTHVQIREVKPSVILEQKTATPISDELKQKIIALIRSEQYSTAEAQINQALNRDNSQHELYLYLLDIHILQRDEFAIDQLISHLRALDLPEIVHQAEQKQKEYEEQKQPDTIDFAADDITIDTQIAEDITTAPAKRASDADFDALIQLADPAKVNFSIEPASIVEAAPIAEEKPLEFNLADIPPLAFTPDSTISTPDLTDHTPLTFDVSTEKEQSVQIEPISVESTPLESTPYITQQPLDSQPIELEAAATTPTTPIETSQLPTLELELTPNEIITAKSEVNETDTQSALPEFQFDQLQLEPTSEVSKAPLAELAPTESVVLTEQLDATTSIAAEPEYIDPLVQEFPELAQLDEIQLDLDLAKQYVTLGAYDSARLLLDRHENEFNEQQRALSKKLLIQIAS